MTSLRSTTARGVLLGAAVLLVAACNRKDDECGGTTCPDPQTARIFVVNAARNAESIQLLVDGQVAQFRVLSGATSAPIAVTPGHHELRAIAVGSGAIADGVEDVNVSATTPRVVVVVDRPAASGPTALLPLVAADTGAIVPAGATKLRVIHGATGAPAVDVWRVQPDFATPTRVMIPFAEQAVSSFIQSTPGTWRVWVTPAGGTDTLAITTVDLAAGQRASVVLLRPQQDASTLKLEIVVEQ